MSAQQAIGQQPLDASGGADLGLPVRAFNRSDQEIVWTYDRVRHVLAPGTQTYVPYMAMVYWQGDPRAINVPGGRAQEQYRRQQREHLRVLYGVYEHDERWAEIPLVECYPIDSDVPFNTVLRDPEGTNMTDAAEGQSQLKLMQETMERMANQVRILQAQVAQKEQEEAAIAGAQVDPADLERQETDTRAASPEEATGQSMVGPAPSRRAPKAKAGVTRDGE